MTAARHWSILPGVKALGLTSERGRWPVEDRTLAMTLLLDFYGELLTEKQRRCFDLHHNEDLSLSEIAELEGISRQGVWDQIRRAETVLEEIEAKTGLLRRFTELRADLERLDRALTALRDTASGETRQQADALLEQLRAMML